MLGWIVAAVITAIVLLLFGLQAFALIECVSFDPVAQRAARAVAAGGAVVAVAVWLAAVWLLSRWGRTPLRRVVLAVALPAAVVSAFFVTAEITDRVVDAIAPSGDHAMCW